MEAGDLIRFSKDHWTRGGLDYTADWIGVVIEYKIGTPNLDSQVSHDRDKDEMRVAWSIFGGTHVMEYDELWWNKLDYEPFEVM